jgi:manganese-dependent inorganic pyrophosphatase
MENRIFVVGHKNPDTDSICSAITYSDLKRKLGENAIACRLGPLNEETKFALKYFGFDNPLLIDDARTHLDDIQMDIPAIINENASIKDAWSLILETSNRSLIVTNSFGKLTGVMSSSNLSITRMMEPADLHQLMRGASLESIRKVVKGELLLGSKTFSDFDGEAHIVTLQSSDKISENFKDSICVLSDGLFKQKNLIETGAKCLIISCGQLVNNEVYELAKEKDVAIITTEKDSMYVAKYIYEAFPIKLLMTKTAVTFNSKDNVVDVANKMRKSRFRSYPVLDDYENIIGQISRYHIQNYNRRQFILVDHSHTNQAIDYIGDAEILEIIDHHNIGNIQTDAPIYYRNQKCGCTCSIISFMYQENGLLPEPRYAGLLLSAILSDTLNFQSKTTTKFDVVSANWLADVAGVNIDEYAQALLKASVALKDLAPTIILNRDLKTYDIAGYKLAIGQTNYHSVDDIQRLLPEFKENLKKEQKSLAYDLEIMMFTQVMGKGSMFVYEGPLAFIMEDLIESRYDGTSGFDPKIISRKQQLIPAMSSLLRKL